MPPARETIEELFTALESPLLSYALRLVGDLSQAEDVVQEAFMKLHGQFDEVREPRRWLYRTAHNLSLNHLRDAGKIVPLVSQAGDDPVEIETSDPEPLPDEQIVRLEGIGLVRLSLKTLDDRSRDLIQLKFNENLSYKEISVRTGLSIGNVGYILHHALKTIGEELARNGVVK
ncbi:MAG TPA: RNA polymerase sigma factor [Candidatus Paceibacterota bacterium]|nr:RNA polymerase sigma factor [Candidatus Paceibacterota bacterium]